MLLTDNKIQKFLSSQTGKQFLVEFNKLSLHTGIEADNDDAIVSFHGNVQQYYNITKERAESIGMSILNYLIGKSDFMIKKLDSRYAGDFTEDGNYFDDDGNVIARDASKLPQTTYFDRGTQGAGPGRGTVLTKELDGTPAYQKWKKRIIQIASLAGWKFVDWLDANQSVEDSIENSDNTEIPKPKRKISKTPVNMQQEGILKELTNKEIYYWAVWADTILEKIFGKIKDENKLTKIYKDALKVFSKKKDRRWIEALNYFYTWRLNHLNENITRTIIKEQLLIVTVKRQLKKL